MVSQPAMKHCVLLLALSLLPGCSEESPVQFDSCRSSAGAYEDTANCITADEANNAVDLAKHRSPRMPDDTRSKRRAKAELLGTDE